VVHLAVHAIVREDAASESELVFAAGRTDDGLVDAARIANLRWPHARLVVLSACQSAAGQVSLTEGATSLARAFLSAGVPAVLANLWPVADQRTAWLQERFHRALVAGRDPAAALQLAQRDAIAAWGRSAAAAAVWGGFEVIGR
jgi:CHAT domain-containing protein